LFYKNYLIFFVLGRQSKCKSWCINNNIQREVNTFENNDEENSDTQTIINDEENSDTQTIINEHKVIISDDETETENISIEIIEGNLKIKLF